MAEVKQIVITPEASSSPTLYRDQIHLAGLDDEKKVKSLRSCIAKLNDIDITALPESAAAVSKHPFGPSGILRDLTLLLLLPQSAFESWNYEKLDKYPVHQYGTFTQKAGGWTFSRDPNVRYGMFPLTNDQDESGANAVTMRLAALRSGFFASLILGNDFKDSMYSPGRSLWISERRRIKDVFENSWRPVMVAVLQNAGNPLSNQIRLLQNYFTHARRLHQGRPVASATELGERAKRRYLAWNGKPDLETKRESSALEFNSLAESNGDLPYLLMRADTRTENAQLTQRVYQTFGEERQLAGDTVASVWRWITEAALDAYATFAVTAGHSMHIVTPGTLIYYIFPQTMSLIGPAPAVPIKFEYMDELDAKTLPARAFQRPGVAAAVVPVPAPIVAPIAGLAPGPLAAQEVKIDAALEARANQLQLEAERKRAEVEAKRLDQQREQKEREARELREREQKATEETERKRQEAVRVAQAEEERKRQQQSELESKARERERRIESERLARERQVAEEKERQARAQAEEAARVERQFQENQRVERERKERKERETREEQERKRAAENLARTRGDIQRQELARQEAQRALEANERKQAEYKQEQARLRAAAERAREAEAQAARELELQRQRERARQLEAKQNEERLRAAEEQKRRDDEKAERDRENQRTLDRWAEQRRREEEKNRADEREQAVLIARAQQQLGRAHEAVDRNRAAVAEALRHRDDASKSIEETRVYAQSATHNQRQLVDSMQRLVSVLETAAQTQSLYQTELDATRQRLMEDQRFLRQLELFGRMAEEKEQEQKGRERDRDRDRPRPTPTPTPFNPPGLDQPVPFVSVRPSAPDLFPFRGAGPAPLPSLLPFPAEGVRNVPQPQPQPQPQRPYPSVAPPDYEHRNVQELLDRTLASLDSVKDNLDQLEKQYQHIVHHRAGLFEAAIQLNFAEDKVSALLDKYQKILQCIVLPWLLNRHKKKALTIKSLPELACSELAWCLHRFLCHLHKFECGKQFVSKHLGAHVLGWMEQPHHDVYKQYISGLLNRLACKMESESKAKEQASDFVRNKFNDLFGHHALSCLEKKQVVALDLAARGECQNKMGFYRLALIIAWTTIGLKWDDEERKCVVSDPLELAKASRDGRYCTLLRFARKFSWLLQAPPENLVVEGYNYEQMEKEHVNRGGFGGGGGVGGGGFSVHSVWSSSSSHYSAKRFIPSPYY